MSQREVATLLGVHEGTISGRTTSFGIMPCKRLGIVSSRGVDRDDLEQFVLTELGGVLTDDPRLSAEELRRLLSAKGKSVPAV